MPQHDAEVITWVDMCFDGTRKIGDLSHEKLDASVSG
jgi:hypothetical protein